MNVVLQVNKANSYTHNQCSAAFVRYVASDPILVIVRMHTNIQVYIFQTQLMGTGRLG